VFFLKKTLLEIVDLSPTKFFCLGLIVGFGANF
jgi:hypothetical protein